MDLEERRWMYTDAVAGTQKGPVAASLILRLLERGVGVSAQQSLVWCSGMSSWQPIYSTEPFTATCAFHSLQWYYLEQGPDDVSTQQKGPFLTRLLLHKLTEGEMDGLTLVISSGMKEWTKASEVPELKEAIRKAAEEEEEAEQRAAAANVEGGSEAVFDSDEQPLQPTLASVQHVEVPAPRNRREDRAASKPQHNWVYITGLPHDCTEEEVLAHFSRVGLVALNPVTQQPKLKLYRREDGSLKGDASLCYAAPESADMAVNVLSEGYLRLNCMVNVTRAAFQEAGGAGGAAAAASAAGGKRKGKGGGGAKGKSGDSGGPTSAQLKTAYAATKQALSWAEDDDCGIISALALKIVVLEGLFSPSDFDKGGDDGGEFEQRLERDIATKCGAFGDIEKITVFSKHPKGVTIVKYSKAFAAQECVRALNGQQGLRVYYWDGSTNFDLVPSAGGKRGRDAGDSEEEREREEKRRLEEFGAWLDQEQEELPEEFQLRHEG